MSEVTFTFDWYETFLERLYRQGYSFDSFDQTVSEGVALLRHDVDWSPRKAVRLAEIEAEMGITSTYFFLVSSPFYNVLNAREREQITHITELGHEIGLHFSTHEHFDSEPDGTTGKSPPDGDLVAAIDRERTLLRMASGVSPDVVSFHNPPHWVFRKSFDNFISTYEDRFFEDIAYRADSNQRWREEPPFDETIPPKLQILTHPVLWGEHDGYSVDRLREEHDYHSQRIRNHLDRTNRMWKSQIGRGSEELSGTDNHR